MIDTIKITKVYHGGSLKASATLTIGGVLALHDIKIIEKENGDFIAMPSQLIKGKYRDIYHPISAPARQVFENLLLRCVEDLMQSQESSLFYQCQNTNIPFLDLTYDDFQIVNQS